MESPSLEQAPPSDGLRGARMAVLFGLLFAALAHSDCLSIQPERPRVPNLKGGSASQKLASSLPFHVWDFPWMQGLFAAVQGVCSNANVFPYLCFALVLKHPRRFARCGRKEHSVINNSSYRRLHGHLLKCHEPSGMVC